MSFEQSFQGKKVLVTGASRGFGRVIVEKLYKHGAKVYALSMTSQNLDKLKQDFPGVETLCVDIRNWDQTRSIVSGLETIDCLVNNAAVFYPKSIMASSPDDFDTIYAVNVKGVMNICQIFAKKLIDSGKPGSIVNITSLAEPRPFTVTALYSTSKGAVQNMTEALALELGPHNIKVNTVAPALMDTDMGADFIGGMKKLYGLKDDAAVYQAMGVRTPLPLSNSLIPMEKVANSTLFFLSDVSGPVTGQRLVVDGGYLLT